MQTVKFNDLADYLRHGREIEFVYNGKQYSITNNKDGWQFCCDTDVVSEILCPFHEFDTLVEKISKTVIEDKTITEIFDQLQYDKKQLAIL